MLASILLLASATSPNEIEQRQSRMTALYEEACLKAFPDDKALEKVVLAKGARELTRDEVKVTLNEDPGRGWELTDGKISALIVLEHPPFHACSVRWPMPEYTDIREYRAIADRYETSKGGFTPMEPYNADINDIHVHAVGEQRILPDGSESLFIFDQHLTDDKRRAAGETGIMFRFVHQFAPKEKP